MVDTKSLETRQRYARAPLLPAQGPVDIGTLLPPGTSRLEVEIGPGRGGFLFERLAAVPDLSMIGFEVSRKWTTLVNDRLDRLGLATRGRVLAEDARLALPRLEPAGKVAVVYLHFPDPWWKKRHAKRLVVGPGVLDEVARLLVPKGELFVQTDVEERAHLYDIQISAHAGFEPAGDTSGSAYMTENPYQATSHRERRAVSDAIPIYRLRFRKR